MKYKNILITGGAGFVGSNLALKLKENYPKTEVIALDNLMRRGSELNLPRLRKGGARFVHGDVRNKEDLNLADIDLLIECSAEPSVMAGIDSSPEYLLNTNLVGAINCFEMARKNGADVIFLSTSRVYPISYLNSLDFKEEKTRFVLSDKQKIKGACKEGISEDFPLDSPRSLYGTTKLAAEHLLLEYTYNYHLKGVINRCGLLTGPWQMGKIDQGVVAFWLAAHVFGKKLTYFGFGGEGKQVRDFLHVDDLFELLKIQIENLKKFNGQTFNVGGGLKNSFSLCELTSLCQKITGKKILVSSLPENRSADVRIYISNTSKIRKACPWQPKKTLEETLREIQQWLITNRGGLENIFFE